MRTLGILPAITLAALVTFVLAAHPGEAIAQASPRTTGGAKGGVSDSFCPTCRAPVSWEDARCAACGAEFEPVRPRVLKSAAASGASAVTGTADAPSADESPFPAPAQGEPADKIAPSKALIDSPWVQIQPPAQGRFGFGSYGRVGFDVGADLKGTPPTDLVDNRPILGKSPYQELHFFYKDKLYDMGVLVKSTLAFNEELFHYNGDFDAQMAVRELYAELAPTDDLAVWIGARMYRGDNVYLFDFWPLDDQNTLGGGAAIRLDGIHKIQAHIGMNRLTTGSNPFYFQTVELPSSGLEGPREVVFLDRNRGTASLTYSIELPEGFKAKVHGEATYTPSDERIAEDGSTIERLPSDKGFLLGGQVGWRAEDGTLKDTTANLFFRYAGGLAAYDELQVPFGFDTDLQVTDAERILVALGGAVETPWLGVLYGAYWQRFQDGDGIDTRNDNDQFAIGARPLVYIGQYFRAGFESTFQALRNKSVFPETGSEELQTLTKLSLMVSVAPRPGIFSRPELMLFFSMKWLNDAAADELGRTRLNERPDRTEQSIGLLAEWWF